MGHKFEVYAWVLNPHRVKDGSEYGYRLEYSGDNMEEAMLKMFELKKAGISCVKFEWRG